MIHTPTKSYFKQKEWSCDFNFQKRTMIHIHANCCSCLGSNKNHKKVIKGEREKKREREERERTIMKYQFSVLPTDILLIGNNKLNCI